MTPRPRASVVQRIALGLWLLAHVLVQVVLAGLATAWFILRPGETSGGELFRMTYEDIDDTGAVLLACLLSLTPGSTTVDLDIERRELLVHVLDASDLDRTVAKIRRQLEVRVRGLFFLERES